MNLNLEIPIKQVVNSITEVNFSHILITDSGLIYIINFFIHDTNLSAGCIQ